MKRASALLVTLCCLATGLGFAGDWPQYRGPDGNGIAPASGLLKGKTFGFEVDWITTLGSGYSSVSVVGETGVTMFSDGTSNVLMAFDINTGKERWRLDIGPVYKGHSGSDDGPTGTPTIHDGTVYAIDPHGRMVAVTLAEGKKLWAHHLSEDVKARLPYYGFCTSPVVIGDKVIVMTGDKEGHAFTAFAAKTGELLWHSGDDTCTYQTPFVWERGGGTKILALTDHFLMELDPSDGRVLWQQEHTITDNESFTPPVLMGENKLLIMHRHEMGAYELTWTGDVAEMKELWRNPRYPQTYSIPIYHEGHLYYFRGKFLTCLNAETGERVWRSRPPGGRALMMLDGHLITVTDDGELVAVEATAEGYREKARLSVFGERTYTPASFSDGYLFLRNLKQMARIKIIDEPTLAQSEIEEPQGIIAELVAQLQSSTDRAATLDAFFGKQQQFPIIEGDGLVHFVFRGEVEDIAVVRGFDQETPLARVPGTDLYFHSEELDPASHWEYHFSSYDEPRVDPLNPLVIGVEPRLRNELRMPKWPVPEFVTEPTGARGRLESLTFASTIREGERNIDVYLPAGYDSSDSRYPLLLVMQGDRALKAAKMDVCLDNLIGTAAAPVIVAFVPTEQSEAMGEHRDAYVQMLTEELVPHLDKTYRTQTDPGSRGIMGALGGSIIASYAALKAPGVFGKLALQTFLFLMFEEQITTLVTKADPSQLEVYIEVSSNDFKRPNFDAAVDSEKLITLLKERGIAVKEHAVTGAPSWGSWRAQTDVILEWFAPLGEEQ